MEDLNEGTCVLHCLENENYNKTLITLSAHRLNTAESYAQQYIDYSLEPYKTIARLFLSSAATSSTTTDDNRYLCHERCYSTFTHKKTLDSARRKFQEPEVSILL